MPSYLITAPNGRKYRVTGEGSADEALAHVQQMAGEGAAGPAGPDFSEAGRGQDDSAGALTPDAIQQSYDRQRNQQLASQSRMPPAGFGDVVDNALTLGLSKDAAALAHALPGEVASWFTGKEHDFGQEYQNAREQERARLAVYGKENPRANLGANALGTLGNLAATAPPRLVMAAATGLPRAIGGGIVAGGEIGGLAGLGESDSGDRLRSAAIGAGTGAAAGAALPLAAEGIVQGARRLAAPIRGLINPEREAARRVAIARQADDAIQQLRLTPQDEQAALQRGQPVLNIDRGGETTRGLARSAANTSPQARAALDNAVQDRFASQGDRTIDTVRRIVGGNTTADSREALQASARAANRPAYARAYGAPEAQGLWDEGLEQLASAPVVQDAIRQATVTGKNAGALGGFPPVRNPFQVDKATGRLTLAADAQGNRVLPNLQFWDHVKRNLDAVGTREAQQASRVLRDHLDGLVPAYRDARAGAAKFFGARDALEAGDQFVMSRMANDEARRGLAKMSQPERQLFAEGFADSLVRRIAEVGDRRSVINSTFIRSRASRERIEMALGPQRARELESFLRVEDLLDRARTAVSGNSTTARQLVELGLAGGTGVYGLATGDWRAAGLTLGGLLLRHGAGRINRQVSQRIGEMLASPDPNIVHRGLQMVARSNGLMEALRRATAPAVNATANQSARLLVSQQAAPAGAEMGGR